MHTYQIPANTLKAVALACSNEETRYYLKGVYLEPRGGHVHLTSTDGHILISTRVAVPDDAPLAEGAPFIVPAHLIAQLKAAKRGKNIATVSVNAENLVSISLDGATFSAKAIDGVFPDYSRVIPDKTDGKLAHFNPANLVKFQKAAELLGEKLLAPAIGHNGDGPALVSLSITLDAIGVIMPVRVAQVCTVAPAWLKRPGFAESVSKLEAAE